MFTWLSQQLDAATLSGHAELPRLRRGQFLIICLTVFFIALGVRLLSWHDNRFEATKVELYVTYDYKTAAQQLLSGDLKAFLGNVNLTGHPPGYPIVLATIFKIFGNSDAVIQFVQIVFDCLAALLIFLIVSELLAVRVAITAGLLVALSPQFSYYPLLLLPDSLAVLPILLAVYYMVRARKRPRLITIIAAGAFVGLSCWLRANALLLAPFLAAAIPVLFERGQRLRYSAALIAGTIIVIAPITIKNYAVFNHFIPLSLGAGQKLLEGIAEYDQEGRFGIPRTDLGIMRQEAELYNRPDYAETLFGPDGIQRDRMRLVRGVAIVRSHPGWYLGVMTRRAASFFRLARVPIVSPDPPVTHSLEMRDRVQPVWSNSPTELITYGRLASGQTEASLTMDGQVLRVMGDGSKYGNQIISRPIAVQKNTDYLFRLPIKLEQGRMIVKVAGEGQTISMASTTIDQVEGKSPEEQPTNVITIPFVSGNTSYVRILLSNGASSPVHPVAQVGQMEMFKLGPTSYQWTRYPRFLIRSIQRFFITAWMIAFTIIGLALLIRARHSSTLTILLIVPVYYLCAHSVLHTERRYVVAIHYFLTMVAAVAVYSLIEILWQTVRELVVKIRRPPPNKSFDRTLG
ncbi:MAG: glycosyltransferase family 39 protein [Acidobacteriia bacterium]|nr:glycosyltransferase family 39 protein [Terriglobia bacterium]